MKNVMQFAMTPAGQVVIIGGAVMLAVHLAEKKTRTVAEAINPVSDQNVFYNGVNSVGAAVTGERDFKLGYWLYDVFHPGQSQ